MAKKYISAIVMVALCLSFTSTAFAKGSSSSRGGGFRSSPSRSVSPTPKPSVTPVSKPRVAPTPRPVAPNTVKAVIPVKTSPTGKTLSTKSKTVGSNGYTPKFRGGYVAPVGSTVYYPQHSMLDYLPWIFLFTMNSHATATVYPPQGTSTVAVAPVEVKDEAVDTMYVINWIVTILLSLGVIAFIMWLINKKNNVKSVTNRW